jgi:hypothetical protein
MAAFLLGEATGWTRRDGAPAARIVCHHCIYKLRQCWRIKDNRALMTGNIFADFTIFFPGNRFSHSARQRSITFVIQRIFRDFPGGAMRTLFFQIHQ